MPPRLLGVPLSLPSGLTSRPAASAPVRAQPCDVENRSAASRRCIVKGFTSPKMTHRLQKIEQDRTHRPTHTVPATRQPSARGAKPSGLKANAVSPSLGPATTCPSTRFGVAVSCPSLREQPRYRQGCRENPHPTALCAGSGLHLHLVALGPGISPGDGVGAGNSLACGVVELLK